MDVKTLVITVLPESEAKAVRVVFDLKGQADEQGEYPVYYYSGGRTVISCIIDKGNTNASTAMDHLLDKYRPENAILVGTCAGRPDKTKIGDVVSSRLGVFDYGQSSLVPGEERRFESIGASGALTKNFSYLKSDPKLEERWWPMIYKAALELGSVVPEKIEAQFWAKAIASGSQIIDERSMKVLTDANEYIYAADQDTAGFASSCSAKHVDWVAVRGVSDCGDRDTRKGNAEYAAIAAATLVKLFLNSSPEASETTAAASDTGDVKPSALLNGTHIWDPHKGHNTDAKDLRNVAKAALKETAAGNGTIPASLGCTHIWVPCKGQERAENERRNDKKLAAIRASTGTRICLLAQTGHSFLYNRGIFYSAVEQHLENDGDLQIVLMAPTVGDDLRTKEENDNIHAKYRLALDGYKDLKKEFSDQIFLRLVPINLPATILLTNTLCFYEPYIHITALREKFLFVAFEMLFDRSASPHGYNLMMKYFKGLYHKGKEYEGEAGR